MGQTTAVITLLSWFHLLTAWNEREQGSHMKTWRWREKSILKAELAHTHTHTPAGFIRRERCVLTRISWIVYLMQNKDGKNSHLTWMFSRFQQGFRFVSLVWWSAFAWEWKTAQINTFVPTFPFTLTYFAGVVIFTKTNWSFCATVSG